MTGQIPGSPAARGDSSTKTDEVAIIFTNQFEHLQKAHRIGRSACGPFDVWSKVPLDAGPRSSTTVRIREDSTMRFMMMHKNDPKTEAGLPPSMEVVQKMGAFIGDHAQAGRLLDGAGLGGSKTRTRLTFREGRCTVKHGPYAGEHELPAGTLLLKVRTRDEAIGWAERYGKILGDGELELGKVNEAWDIGLAPMPENPPLQMLLIEKASAATEAGGHSAQTKAALTRLKTEMTKAGVLLRTIALTPSSNGKRLNFTNNQLRMLDGPFTESKELLGGFAVLELPDFDAAIAMSKPYVEILGGTLEMDVRVLEDDEPAD